MAELPLIEATKRSLAPHLASRTIEGVQIMHEDRIAYPDPEQFVTLLKGKTVSEMIRHGKLLGLRFSNGDMLWFHFRMNGQLRLAEPAHVFLPHTHLVLDLDDGMQLRLRDTRCLCHVWYVQSGEPDIWTGRSELGPDCLGNDFTLEYLRQALSGSRKIVKGCLLDQHMMAGIGNIYADEILFEARIGPSRTGKSLHESEIQTLFASIQRVLREETDRMAATPGFFLGQNVRLNRGRGRKVYGRQGKPCPNCGTLLEAARVAGRSTTYCPVCQKQKI